MNLLLKPFQIDAVEKLIRNLRYATKESKSGSLQAVSFSSPTGSGKTVMATSVIETLIQGDSNNPPNPEATFLWITDQPELNEQTRRKMLIISSFLTQSKLIVIDSTFDMEIFKPGVLYFLNIQKLGKDKQLIIPGDNRNFTIWETINNTSNKRPGNFFVFIDEAHRGMNQSQRAINEANTIIQKFIKGSLGELKPVPLVIGISATPSRFNKLIEGTERAMRPTVVDPEVVRSSGLIKETITLYHPRTEQPSDFTMLRAAAGTWKSYCEEWKEYCIKQNEAIIYPILTIQVQDGKGKQISHTNISEAIRAINEEVGPLPVASFAHAFQEGKQIGIGSQELRYLAPPDIETDPDIQIVFFKTSLNTGWDCPRAEVMMSFRTASDATFIAQLVGRMVRTPLARRIDENEHLNSVALYLPHYSEQELNKVITQLTDKDSEDVPPVEVKDGGNILSLKRAPDCRSIFEELKELPSYVVPRSRKVSQIKRLMKLSRLLSNDGLMDNAPEQATQLLLTTLQSEYSRLKDTERFKKIVEERGKIEVRAVNWRYTSDIADDNEIIKLDISTENVEDLFEQAGKKLREGLHKAWWKARVKQDSEARMNAKLELFALCIDQEVINKIENEAQSKVQRWLNQFRLKINSLPESRQQNYSEIRHTAQEPEEVTISYPTVIEGKSNDRQWQKHLYVNDENKFSEKFNNWEAKVLEEELKRDDIIGWLRNPPRKEWSLCVPYEMNNEFYPCYPDFLIVRSDSGQITVDIIDPHLSTLEDAWYKARGMAKYAAKHGSKFGRIEIVNFEKENIYRLNLCEEKVREKVDTITNNEQLRQLLLEFGHQNL